MRALEKIRRLQTQTGAAAGDYDVSYEYDAKGRVEKETVTGSIQKITTYGYDANDNITTETIVEGGKTTTRTYEYTDGNVTHIQVRES